MNLTKCICLATLVALVAGAFPYNIHAGKLTSLLRTTDAQDFVDLTEALKTNDSSPATTIPDYMRKSLPPDEGSVYVILTISVEAGRSISLADYVLSADGTDCECVGITLQKLDFFDPRRFKVNGPESVKLLFKCPVNAENCDLMPAPGFPLAPVKNMVLIEKAPEPAPAPEAPADNAAAPAENAEAAPAENAEAAPAENAEAAPAENAEAAAPAAPAAEDDDAVPAKPVPGKKAKAAKPAEAEKAAKPAEAEKAAKPAAAEKAAKAEPEPKAVEPEPEPEKKEAAPKPPPKPKQEEESWF